MVLYFRSIIIHMSSPATIPSLDYSPVFGNFSPSNDTAACSIRDEVLPKIWFSRCFVPLSIWCPHWNFRKYKIITKKQDTVVHYSKTKRKCLSMCWFSSFLLEKAVTLLILWEFPTLDFNHITHISPNSSKISLTLLTLQTSWPLFKKKYPESSLYYPQSHGCEVC